MMASLRIVQTSQSDPREHSGARQKKEETLDRCVKILFFLGWAGSFFFCICFFLGEGGGGELRVERDYILRLFRDLQGICFTCGNA